MTRPRRLLLLNGPNLGILGRRKPEVYGTTTLPEIVQDVEKELAADGWAVEAVQREGEGELITAIQDHWDDTDGAVVNPGALMMTGWGLRDALESYPQPWVEVHISNVWARESFRHESVLSPLAHGVIVGLGPRAYRLAARAVVELAGEGSIS